MPWSDIRSQPLVCDLLRRSMLHERMHHGYLLIGEDSETEAVARAFARALNCEKQDGDFCGQCPSCKDIQREQHSDVHWLRPESKSRRTVIDAVRELERAIYLKPGRGRVKVAVVSAADRLQHEAQDAFLKTLEEPPAGTVFLLLTNEPEQLKETIRSRCLGVLFRPVERKTKSEREQKVETWLAELAAPVPPEQSVILRAYGFTGRLLGMLGETRKEKLAAIEERLNDPSLEFLESSSRKRLEEQLAAQAHSEYVRERSNLLKLMAEWFHARQADARSVEILEKLSAQLARNVNEPLAFEIAMLKLSDSLKVRG